MSLVNELALRACWEPTDRERVLCFVSRNALALADRYPGVANLRAALAALLGFAVVHSAEVDDCAHASEVLREFHVWLESIRAKTWFRAPGAGSPYDWSVLARPADHPLCVPALEPDEFVVGAGSLTARPLRTLGEAWECFEALQVGSADWVACAELGIGMLFELRVLERRVLLFLRLESGTGLSFVPEVLVGERGTPGSQPEVAVVEGWLSRGRRRLSMKSCGLGCRMDAWIPGV
jgi:hypothetical protein